jgi:uncharacterized protein YjbJ (UPF0337 family)
MRNEDEIKGKAKKAWGDVKDKAGEVTGDPNLEAEGEADRAEGDIQDKFGQGRRKVGEKISEVGKKIGS